MAASPTKTLPKTAEQAIGEFLLGFIGDPQGLADDKKWYLYEVLLDAGELLGEVVNEAWRAALTDGTSAHPEHRWSKQLQGYPAPRD